MDRKENPRVTQRAMRAGAALCVTLLLLTGCATISRALFAPKLDPGAVSLAPGDFRLDPAHGALLFRIDHLGYSDFVGRFDRFEASLTGDPAQPESARIEAIIDMTSLNIANPEFAAELMGAGWFDAERHPQAIFRADSAQLTGEHTAEITGDLTLKGTTRPVSLSARLNGSAYDPLRRADVIGFSAKGEISRAAFGIDRFSGLLTDQVRIEIEAEFVRNRPD